MLSKVGAFDVVPKGGTLEGWPAKLFVFVGGAYGCVERDWLPENAGDCVGAVLMPEEPSPGCVMPLGVTPLLCGMPLCCMLLCGKLLCIMVLLVGVPTPCCMVG